MMEFNCKVSSTWSHDDRTKDEAFAHRMHGDGGQGSCRIWSILSGRKRGTTDLLLAVKERDSWDHWLQEGRDAEHTPGKE